LQNSHDLMQRSAEWFEARKGRITASSVGAILGNSPNATRADVMRRMVREWHGAESEFTGNIATEYGQNNEAGALVEYQMDTGNTVEAVGFVTREDWAWASPNGLIGVDGISEIRCPFGLRDAGTEEKPLVFKSLSDQPHYYDQVQFQIWVTGRDWCHFYQWSPKGSAMETVLQDAEWQAVSLPKLRQFYAEYLAERDNPETHLAPKRHVIDMPEAARIVAEYDQLSEAIENATARKQELLADMVRMASEKDAVIAGRNLTKVERAGAVAYAKAIAELLPSADLEKWRGKPTEYWSIK
jgi:putative phage-type endonuclease